MDTWNYPRGKKPQNLKLDPSGSSFLSQIYLGGCWGSFRLGWGRCLWSRRWLRFRRLSGRGIGTEDKRKTFKSQVRRPSWEGRGSSWLPLTSLGLAVPACLPILSRLSALVRRWGHCLCSLLLSLAGLQGVACAGQWQPYRDFVSHGEEWLKGVRSRDYTQIEEHNAIPHPPPFHSSLTDPLNSNC